MLLLLVLQAAVMHRFSTGIWRLDLPLMLAAYMALEAASGPALVCGVLIGLLRDLASQNRLGVSVLVIVPATAAVLLVRDKVYRQHVVTHIVFAFLFVFLCGMLEAAGTWALVRPAHLGVFLKGALGRAVLTSVFAPVGFWLMDLAGLLQRDDSEPA
jgi:rod shape-determining protein MreD